MAAVCSVCEEFAAVSSNDASQSAMCGNCIILAAKEPADTFAKRQAELRKVEQAKRAKASIMSGATDAPMLIADLQQQNDKLISANEALKADNAALKAEVENIKLKDKVGDQKPGQQFGSQHK